jgi:hypothetical protein
MLHARQITYVYKRNQRLDSMHRYETLAMDEMQKDFLGFSNRQAC